VKRAGAAVTGVAALLVAACIAAIVYATRHEGESPVWKIIEQGGQWAMLLMILGSLFAARKMGARFAGPRDAWSPRPPGPDSRFGRTVTYQREYAERFARRARWVSLLFAIIVLANLGLSGYMMAGATHPVMLLIGSSVFIFMLLLLLIVLVSLRMGRRWLAIFAMEPSSAGLRVTSPAWTGALRRANVPWRDVYWDGWHILVGKRLVSVRTGRWGDAFDRRAFEERILPHIPATNFVDAVDIVVAAYRARSPEVLAFVAIVLAGLAMTAAVEHLKP